ncbi:hypothetical protein MB46_19810 (plasmid) [Arthrobacter alpinus]|nr:hypothetical protein MB46_19810 [Arthrobacter alpinus]
MENHSSNATQALAAIHDGNESAAKYARSPWWYYPVIGAGYALLGLAAALSGSIVRTIAVLAFLALGKLLEKGYRRANGVWVGGLKSGANTWWTLGFLLVSLGTIVAGCLVSDHMGAAWPAWIMAVLVLLETLIYGFLFDRGISGERHTSLS